MAKAWCCNRPENRIAEQIRASAVVEPEAHFVEVGQEMPEADVTPTARDASDIETRCAEEKFGREAPSVILGVSSA